MLISDKRDPQKGEMTKQDQLTASLTQLGSSLSLVLHVALSFIPDKMQCTWKEQSEGDLDDSGTAYVGQNITCTLTA